MLRWRTASVSLASKTVASNSVRGIWLLCCMDSCLPFKAPPKRIRKHQKSHCVIQRNVTIIVACVSKRINIATIAASQQKKAQLNDKQFTSHFLVS